MDAGLAALLSAAVGALGTGGAALATGLLGRGQARTQLGAEHVRLLREPQRAAYVAFAQCFQEVHTLHSEAAKSASEMTQAEEPDRSRLLNAADEAYARAGERLHGELSRRRLPARRCVTKLGAGHRCRVLAGWMRVKWWPLKGVERVSDFSRHQSRLVL
ncbi:hypothetical protein [Streptomyces sp. NPDC087859]|uniref:hypothetical protein n=1 Tax=Streptomyces sp. NPDC087859 TaxID=3365812 RepID=UPI00382B6BCB